MRMKELGKKQKLIKKLIVVLIVLEVVWYPSFGPGIYFGIS
jgi:hypothetical protein